MYVCLDSRFYISVGYVEKSDKWSVGYVETPVYWAIVRIVDDFYYK